MQQNKTRSIRPSYNVVHSIDAFLSQLLRLTGRGYYFCFYNELKEGKDPLKLDAKLIEQWQLDKPYWRREPRYRGKAPSVWYLRFERHYVLLSTKGRCVEKGKEGEPHPFFIEYEKTLFDIRKYALYFCGYSIRYPKSRTTGKHHAFVRLDKPTYQRLHETLCKKAISERYRERSAIEAEFQNIPWQPYREVGVQIRRILNEVNRRRVRYKGFAPARVKCVRWRIRTVKVYDDEFSARDAARLTSKSHSNSPPNHTAMARRGIPLSFGRELC